MKRLKGGCGSTDKTVMRRSRPSSALSDLHAAPPPPAQSDESTRGLGALARRAALVEFSEDPIIGLTLEGFITDWNPAAERLYGYSCEEALGASIGMLVPPELRGSTNLLRRVRAGESITQVDTQRMAKDGERIDVSISLSPIRDAHGAIVGAAAFTRDIRARVLAEERLRNSEAQLAEAQHLAGVGSWEWDVRQNKVSWSEELYRINGLHPDEFTPTYEGFLETVHPDDLDMVTSEVERAFAERGSFTFDQRAVRPDGTIRVIAARGQAVSNEAGEVVRMVGTAQDITERHAVDRMKSEFISVVSHEIRTPLTSIRGALGLLAGGLLGPLPEQGQRMLDIAVENGARLGRLIDDILDIERIGSGTASMRMEPADVGSLMQQACHTVQAMADHAGVVISVSPAPAHVCVDHDRIVQTLTNLLSNAVKFSESEGTVRVWAEKSGDEVIFGVQDEGRGIPSNQLESIFERFHQVDGSDARAHAGTGLGLAIARSIVNQHRGRIWVESELGKGSTFFFALPAAGPK